MKAFNLPDLGEGLPDAEIREWHVKVGDNVKVNDLLVSMETAKAVVDVPSPFHGVIAKLHGDVNDIVRTGKPLVSFESDEEHREDTGTVVGHLEKHEGEYHESMVVIKSDARAAQDPNIRVTPAVRAFAQRMGVDLTTLTGTGLNGLITISDVKHAQLHGQAPEGFEPIKGSRRMMMQAMRESHREVCPVTLCDDADISAWRGKQDITARIIRAIIKGCAAEPSVNATYDDKTGSRRMNTDVHLGLAVDSPEGLFVPVIHEAQTLIDEPQRLRALIDEYKQSIRERSIDPTKFGHATITFSNYGIYSGKYGTPIIIPPQVVIVGTGSKRDTVVAKNGQAVVATVLPLSITFDHRAVTGGETARFLAVMMQDLALEI